MDSIPSSHLSLWMLLIGAWIVFAIWHSRENRELLRQMGVAGFEGIFVAQMVKFAWSRSAQQLMLMFIMTASIIAFDWHYLQLRPSPLFSIVVTPKTASVVENQPVAEPQMSFSLPLQNPNWQFSPMAEIVAATPQPQAFSQTQTESLAQLAPASGGTPPNVTPATEAELEALRKAGLVQQIYEPAMHDSGQQAQLDSMKQNYEELFISYYFLSKCGHARDEQYYAINAALTQEVSSMQADPQLQNDIISAAEGSYNEIYSKLSCSSQDLESMANQFEAYTDSLAHSFSALH